MKSLPSGWKYSIGLIVSILLLFAANLWVGSVRIPAGAVWDILCGHAVERESWRFILLESRIPQGITALLCGAALAVSGLMLQTVFSNPLAGPSVLGISSGASMGVAFVKSYAAICLEGCVIVLACVIFSQFAASPPAIADDTLAAATIVWNYIGELIFNMLVLVGAIKMSDRLIRELMGLG